jgi:hypothetical protein
MYTHWTGTFSYTRLLKVVLAGFYRPHVFKFVRKMIRLDSKTGGSSLRKVCCLAGFGSGSNEANRSDPGSGSGCMLPGRLLIPSLNFDGLFSRQLMALFESRFSPG